MYPQQHTEQDENSYEAAALGSFSAQDDLNLNADQRAFTCFGDTLADESMLVGSRTEFSMPFGSIDESLDPLNDPSCGSDVTDYRSSYDRQYSQYDEDSASSVAPDDDSTFASEGHDDLSSSEESLSEELFGDVSAKDEDFESKIELTSQDEVEDQLKPNILLDQEAIDREARIEAREDAQLHAFYSEENLSTNAALNAGPDFRLLSYDMSDIDVDGSDDDDFVTGNVTTLRTGTDDVVIAAAQPQRQEEETEVEEEKEPEEIALDADDDFLTYSPTMGDYAHLSEDKEHLVPCLIRDFWSHFLTYALAFILCGLCLAKVYQVQDTRDITARLNEVAHSNFKMETQWLALVAERQNLSEHAKIRVYATEKLQMVSPKTEAEHVISLH